MYLYYYKNLLLIKYYKMPVLLYILIFLWAPIFLSCLWFIKILMVKSVSIKSISWSLLSLTELKVLTNESPSTFSLCYLIQPFCIMHALCTFFVICSHGCNILFSTSSSMSPSFFTFVIYFMVIFCLILCFLRDILPSIAVLHKFEVSIHFHDVWFYLLLFLTESKSLHYFAHFLLLLLPCV